MIGKWVLGLALTEVKHVLNKNNTAERRVHWLPTRKYSKYHYWLNKKENELDAVDGV
jgi:hypothetical protein